MTTIPDVSFWTVIQLNAPEWKSISLASFCSLVSGFAMPLLAVILGDFIGVRNYYDSKLCVYILIVYLY